MNKRNTVRYDIRLLPESLSKVVISWEEDYSIESSVENFCSHGMRVSIPSMSGPLVFPKINDTVQVLIQIDSSQQICFSGQCVYTIDEQDSNLSLGIYFYNPNEQNDLHIFLCNSLNEQP
jgi:hypothetical protein